MLKRIALSLTSLFMMLLVLAPATAHAVYDPYAQNAGNNSINCSQAADSAFCKSVSNTKNPVYGKDSLLLKVVNLVAIFSAVIAVFIIVLAGGRFVTSGGDPNNVKTARNTILYAVIGLVVIALSRTIIVYVINHVG